MRWARWGVGGGLVVLTITTLTIFTSYSSGGTTQDMINGSAADIINGATSSGGGLSLTSMTKACRKAFPTTSKSNVGAILAVGTSNACRVRRSCVIRGSKRSRTDKMFGMLSSGMLVLMHPSDNRRAFCGIGSSGGVIVASSINGRPRNRATGRCILGGEGWGAALRVGVHK